MSDTLKFIRGTLVCHCTQDPQPPLHLRSSIVGSLGRGYYRCSKTPLGCNFMAWSGFDDPVHVGLSAIAYSDLPPLPSHVPTMSNPDPSHSLARTNPGVPAILELLGNTLIGLQEQIHVLTDEPNGREADLRGLRTRYNNLTIGIALLLNST